MGSRRCASFGRYDQYDAATARRRAAAMTYKDGDTIPAGTVVAIAAALVWVPGFGPSTDDLELIMGSYLDSCTVQIDSLLGTGVATIQGTVTGSTAAGELRA